MTGKFTQHVGRWGLLLIALALIGLRAPHLAGPLDDPHSWRQCDTIHYSLDFYRNGIDVLRPAVSWMGGHRTLIFEFPLTEAMSAGLYHAFGPDPLWDRLVSLAFCIIAAAYLFMFVRWLAGSRVAWFALLAYLAFPLGQFFSRAPQMDFAAAAFSHALLYHLAIALRTRAHGHVIVAAVAGVLAALLKAPYLIPVLGPLAIAALALPTFATLVIGAVALGIPAIVFVVWRRHVDVTNGAAPDWMFLPGYYKEVNPLWWYIGSWAQRFEADGWLVLARRLVRHIATPLGCLLAIAGLWWRREARRATVATFVSGDGRPHFSPLVYALAWWGMGLGYVAVFFPLNVIHHYYQVPLLGPTALMIALGADVLWRRLPRIGPVRPAAVVYGAFLVFCVTAVAELGYYRVDWLRVEAGRMIAESVPADQLVVASDHGSVHSDPRLLVRADRSGWPLPILDIDPERLSRLARLGARWVAVVTDPVHPGLEPPGFLEPALVQRAAIRHDGQTLGTLHLYELALISNLDERRVEAGDEPIGALVSEQTADEAAP